MYTIYSILNKDAKNWWYHAELRKRGEVTEARKRERDSIRLHLEVLRKAIKNHGFASVGRGGWSVDEDKHARLSGYGGVDEPIIQACILLGIPVCDSTTISEDQIIKVVSFPMASTCPDPLPADGYRAFDYAPASYVFGLYKELGATVYNL